MLINSRYKTFFYSFFLITVVILSTILFMKQGSLIVISPEEESVNKKVESSNKKNQEAPLRGEVAPYEGFMAPDFTFPDIHGKSVSLSQFRGKIVFLNIWATWCGPCRIEMPAMEKLWQKFKKEDFVILAVSIDRQGKSVVMPFMQELGLTFPVLLDPDGAIQITYEVNALPSSFIIDKTGFITARVTGARDWFGSDTIETFKYLINET